MDSFPSVPINNQSLTKYYKVLLLTRNVECYQNTSQISFTVIYPKSHFPFEKDQKIWSSLDCVWIFSTWFLRDWLEKAITHFIAFKRRSLMPTYQKVKADCHDFICYVIFVFVNVILTAHTVPRKEEKCHCCCPMWNWISCGISASTFFIMKLFKKKIFHFKQTFLLNKKSLQLSLLLCTRYPRSNY